MKTKLAILVLIALLASSLSAAPPRRSSEAQPMAAAVDNEHYIDVNKLLMFVTNHGNFGRDLTDVFHQDYGTFYPFTSVADLARGVNNNGVLYAAGLWAGAKVGDSVHVVVAEYSDEYVPGPMSGGTFMTDRPEFRVYKLFSDSLAANPNQDYLDWPYDQGAPWDTTAAGDTIPGMIGDQMTWAVFNDANPTQHNNDAGNSEPLGIEVRQTTFGFDQSGSLGNMVFIRLRVVNKGANTLDSCFFSLWADPDLGGSGDDFVGCDTTLGLGYCYNATNTDAQYGATPPAIGFDFFQGPLVAGTAADTAIMWGQRWPGMKNLGMYSFNKYINGTDPNSKFQTYNYMKGLDANGAPYVYQGNQLLYVASGNPVTGVGDIDVNPADRRFMESTGPITFAPGDSTEILAAIIIGQGGNRLESVTSLFTRDDYAQRIYEGGFQPPQPPVAPNVHVSVIPGEVTLAWDDTSQVDHGTYPFMGYTVWQCPDGSGQDCIELATYDPIDTIFTQAIVDTIIDPYSGILIPQVQRALSNDGLKLYYSTSQDAFTGLPIRDIQKYYFEVSAFTFADHDSLGALIPYGDRFKERFTQVSVTPQEYMPGVEVAGNYDDTLATTHTAGVSDVEVYPVILDPLQLNGHTYRVWFNDDMGDTLWNLMDVTTGDTLLYHRTNYSGLDGNEPYYPTDGFVVKVISSQGVVAIQEIANSTGPITPDNVMYELNSTGDWYVNADQSGNFARMNWQGLIGVDDWDFKFIDSGSQYYNWNTDGLWPNRCPFEVWNIGPELPNDPANDRRIQINTLDDDGSGTWTYGDRIYPSEVTYGTEPLPDPSVYVFPDDFHIGRIVFTDYSGATTQPDSGTVVRFITAKVPMPTDTFTFVATAPTLTESQSALDDIRVVPNPFYLYGPYDPGPGKPTIKFHGLPAQCTIDIYNLNGEYIDQIVKNDPSTSIAEWDGATQNGLPVASGVYIYVVDAPGFGQKIGKFAVFMEVEVLRDF